MAPPPPRPTDEISVKTRIFAAATRLFAEKGYGSTSVREVVEAAGVTKPALYYYFANKEALFVELVTMHMDQLSVLIRVSLDGSGTVRQRLQAFLQTYVDGAIEHTDIVRLMWTAQHRTDDKQPKIDLMSMHLRKMSLLVELFHEGVQTGELRDDFDVDYAVRALVGILNLHTMACVHGLPSDDDYADRILDLFYRGVSG